MDSRDADGAASASTELRRRAERLPGGHLSGIEDAAFAEAKAAFVVVEDVEDGLGPIFNERGCGNCHTLGAIGGAGVQIERRFGRFDHGVFNPLENEGGSLRQLFANDPFTNADGRMCVTPLEVLPADATVRDVGRLTTPLFGLGLVDAMPDSFFEKLAQDEPEAVRGRVNLVSLLLPDPKDRKQRVGGSRVGRFGWKAGVATLAQFAADAYVNEMGITTQHCIRGESILSFATESAPNGVPVAAGCDDAIPGTDEEVGPCSGGLTELQEDVELFTTFMTFLAPPPRNGDNNDLKAYDDDAPQGRKLFDKTGCADCHTRRAFETPRKPANGVPGNFEFFPFSDFLLHDMGDLGDRIGNAGDAKALTRQMRTAPLWGIRFRTLLLHDGRATTIEDAIAAHDGQGAAAARAFRRLRSSEQKALVDFVKSL